MQTQNTINTLIEETGGWVASQLEACTRCGMCAEACHFYQATGNPEYSPVWKIELLRRAYEQNFTIGGKIKKLLGIEKEVTEQDLESWSKTVYEACTVCNKCSMVCPMGIDLGPIIHNVRTGLQAAGMVPKDLADAVQKQVDEGSPLGVTDDVFEDRIEWIEDDWEVDIPMDVKGADTLVVFTSIEIMKFPNNLAAIATIMNKAGENWTLSSAGREVVNFGYFEGNPERTKLFLNRVIDAAKDLGVKRVMVTECGHAYDAFRWTAHNMVDVPKDLEFTHIVAVLDEFIKAGRIKMKPGAFDKDGTVTFHDACKIQRRGGHIQEPRDILNILAPQSFKELTPNKEQSLCCGGGGGVIAIKEADENRFAAFGLKVDQLKKVGAKTVAMACSNCRLQFTEGVQHYDLDVKVTGLSQMVFDALED